MLDSGACPAEELSEVGAGHADSPLSESSMRMLNYVSNLGNAAESAPNAIQLRNLGLDPLRQRTSPSSTIEASTPAACAIGVVQVMASRSRPRVA